MATSYGALCSDFYINQKFALKMDLPTARETVLDLFDRIRKTIPSMDRFRRYDGELSLESPVVGGQYAWVGLRETCVKSGYVNPDSLDDAYGLHLLLLEICPYFLSISPLDVDYVELVFGFDLEARGNHDAIVYEALMRDTPVGRLLDTSETQPIDVQPFIGMSLDAACDLQAYFEVKTRTPTRDVRAGEYHPEPISVYLTVRKYGAVDRREDLAETFESVRRQAEQLVEDRVLPHLVAPLRQAIETAGFQAG
ncbi:MAG: hypothetical protein KAS72_04230 [Phycisphaerales bacterium]|nr:hypothetical protein [Phycisphaerales bacterium]